MLDKFSPLDEVGNEVFDSHLTMIKLVNRFKSLLAKAEKDKEQLGVVLKKF